MKPEDPPSVTETQVSKKDVESVKVSHNAKDKIEQKEHVDGKVSHQAKNTSEHGHKEHVENYGAGETSSTHTTLSGHTSHHRSHSSHVERYIPHVVVLLLILAVVNIYLVMSASSVAEEQIAIAQEDARAPELSLISITDKSCPKCFDISQAEEALKSGKVNITEERSLDISDAKAQELLTQYSIKKVPTLIVTGELKKASLSAFEKRDDAYVFTTVVPPYTDSITGKKEGLVQATIIQDGTCNDCPDSSLTLRQFAAAGVVVDKTTTLDVDDAESLLASYSITRLPAILISQELKVYEEIASTWNNIGSVEKDGTYVMRSIGPPYVNLTTGAVEGLVDSIYVLDASCGECFTETVYKNVFRNFGLAFSTEKVYDAASVKGKEIIAQYSIKKLPTVILSPAAGVYPSLANTWQQAGTVEDDNTRVFRNVEILGQSYKDLVTGEVVTPARG